MRAFLLLTLLSNPAWATQVNDVNDYSGSYDLWCDTATLGLHLGLTVTVAGVSTSWGQDGTWTLPCSVPPAALRAFTNGLKQDCVAGGLPLAVCRPYAEGLYAALLPFSNVEDDVLPDLADLMVAPADPLQQLLGVYTLQGVHTWADGSVQRWDYWIDNNLGQEGHFVTLAGAWSPISTPTGTGCTSWALAAIDGRIDRYQGFAVDAAYGVTSDITCGGIGPTYAWLGDIGLTLNATMGGVKL